MAGVALADPPALVGRIGYVEGSASFSPAGEASWVEAPLNRPLVSGDQLWADANGRIELQIGTSAVRMGANTSVTLLDLGDTIAQLQLAQGTLSLSVRRVDPGQAIEIDTPNLAYVIRRPGQYALSVGPNGESTEVRTMSGQAEVYGKDENGESQRYVVDAGKRYRFQGPDLRDPESLRPSQDNDFDRWAQQRDRSYDRSVSARYVSRDVIGAQDLDAYGSWRAVPEYGNVWTPTRVSADWSPYSNGHWAWVDPWGWSWVDDAPWGFAVSHYGRWARFGDSWGWIPGPVATRAVYAPALVVFIGGGNFQIANSSGNTGAVGWFPLGPREVYRPAYTVSRGYFTNVNASNTSVNAAQVTNIYDQRSVTNVTNVRNVTNVNNITNVRNVTYVNEAVKGAVIAVPATAFVQAQPVAPVAVRVSRDALAGAPLSSVAEVAPQPASVRGAARHGSKPPADLSERHFIAHQAPPAATVSFAKKEPDLAKRPGKPIDAAELASLKPPVTTGASRVEVVAPLHANAPAAPPPPRAEQRSDDKRKTATVEPAAVPPAMRITPPEPRGKPEVRVEAKDAPVAATPKVVAPQPPHDAIGKPSQNAGSERSRQAGAAASALNVPQPATSAMAPPRRQPIPIEPAPVAEHKPPPAIVPPPVALEPKDTPVVVAPKAAPAARQKPPPAIVPPPVTLEPKGTPVNIAPKAEPPKDAHGKKPLPEDEGKNGEKSKRDSP